MALRKPLVVSSGLIQQLQSGDTLDTPGSGGELIAQTNDEVGSIVIGAPVYNDVASGVKKAQANAAGTRKVLGLVYDTSINAAASGNIITGGVLAATTGQWDSITGGVGGLAVGTVYFLSAATAGLLTSTAPSAVGQYVVEVGMAISTTEMQVRVQPGILL